MLAVDRRGSCNGMLYRLPPDRVEGALTKLLERETAWLPAPFSAVDGSREGWTIEDSVVFARELEIIGVDVIDDNSSGGFGVFDYPMGYGFQVPFAA